MNRMRKVGKIGLLSLFMTLSVGSFADDDPVLMTIGGTPVTRSEFEYSYNKNNSTNVIDRKSVDEYVDLFINYKLKVIAAKEAQLDTLSSFKKEYLSYRNPQLYASFVTDADVEEEAKKVYDNTKKRVGADGLVDVSVLLQRVSPNATPEMKAAKKATADSLYAVIKAGADFATMAKKYSDDQRSGANGGKIGSVYKGQMMPEMDAYVFSHNAGDISAPIETSMGYMIMKINGRHQMESYDSMRTKILDFLEKRKVRDNIAKQKIADLSKKEGKDQATLLDEKAAEMAAKDSSVRYLMQEYHDGLLMYEMSDRQVWKKASEDNKALENYYKANKKKYKWDAPRFKGVAYYTKLQSDVERVKSVLKGVPFDDWATVLRKEFNKDSIMIRADKGIFAEGDNDLVDKEIFKKDVTPKEVKDYPYAAVYGEKVSKPETYTDVRGLVVSDYQNELEEQWVKDLRKRYSVSVDKNVLSTVNKH